MTELPTFEQYADQNGLGFLNEADRERCRIAFNFGQASAQPIIKERDILREKVEAWNDPLIKLGPFVGTCAICAEPENYTYLVPEALWREIVPEAHQKDIVCAGCFHELSQPSGHTHGAFVKRRAKRLATEHEAEIENLEGFLVLADDAALAQAEEIERLEKALRLSKMAQED